MIRKLEKTDLAQVIKIWFDVHIKARGFVSTDLWISGEAKLKAAMDTGEVYVVTDKRTVTGFMHIDGSHILNFFVSEGRHYKKACAHLFDHAKTLSSHLILHAFQNDEDAVKVYDHAGFIKSDESTNEFTGEPEKLYEWNS